MADNYKFLSDIVASERELDIRSYTQKIKEELVKLEDQCLSDYSIVAQDVAVLYSELDKSSTVLDKIDSVVESFQEKLGAISQEVATLQSRSENLNISLSNRRCLQENLSDYLGCILLPEDLIDDLCNNDVEIDARKCSHCIELKQVAANLTCPQEYLMKVKQLDRMLSKAKEMNYTSSKALEEVRPQLDKLKYKVCSRARNFLISKMNNLQKPKSNFQIYQESVLLKFKPLVAFVRTHHQETYIELTSMYADIMDSVYYTMLNQYFKDTAKLIEKTQNKAEQFFGEKGGMRDSIGGTNTSMNTTIEFAETLRDEAGDERAQILDRLDEQPIVIAISQSKQKQYPFEEVFRSQNKLIIDCVCKEFIFVLDFFDFKMVQISPIFNQIFARVVNKYLDWLTQYNCPSVGITGKSLVKSVTAQATSSGQSVAGGLDVYAVLLCLQINKNFKKIMQQRNKIPVLDFYHDRVSQALWPKFTSMFQIYIESVQKALPRNFRIYESPVVHSVTTKYVSFVSGVYHLIDEQVDPSDTSEGFGSEMVMLRLTSLKTQMMELLERMASDHYGRSNGGQQAIVFMINNLHFIVTHLSRVCLHNTVKDLAQFEKELAKGTEQFIQILLKQHFLGLEQIVGEFAKKPDDSGESSSSSEITMGGGTTSLVSDLSKLNKRQLESVAQDFSFTYKQKAEVISKEIKNGLVDQSYALQTSQKLMRILSLRYSTFLEITKAAYPNYLKEMPSNNQVLQDLRNTSLNH